MINFFHNLHLFRVKNAKFFAEFFGENILKNHNIGPWSPCMIGSSFLGSVKSLAVT
jgi:hypothetical protein